MQTTSGEILPLKDILFILMVCKQTVGKMLQNKDSLYNDSMQTKKWQNYTESEIKSL